MSLTLICKFFVVFDVVVVVVVETLTCFKIKVQLKANVGLNCSYLFHFLRAEILSKSKNKLFQKLQNECSYLVRKIP